MILILRWLVEWSPGRRGTLFTLLSMNEESPDMSAIEPTLDQLEAYCRASQKAVSAHFTSKQILPFAFEEQHSAVSAYFTSKQKLPFAIQENSDPEKPGLIRTNTMDVLVKS